MIAQQRRPNTATPITKVASASPEVRTKSNGSASGTPLATYPRMIIAATPTIVSEIKIASRRRSVAP